MMKFESTLVPVEQKQQLPRFLESLEAPVKIKKNVDLNTTINKKQQSPKKAAVEEHKERRARKESKREKEKVVKNQYRIAKNDKLKAYFEKIAGTDRMTKARLTEFMASRYPFEPHDQHGVYDPSICYSMVKNLWLFLDSVGSDLKYESFYEKIERWMN